MKTATKFNLRASIEVKENGIVSTRVLEKKTGGVTLFSFDKDQRLSEHTAPFDAFVVILEGNGEIIIDKISHLLSQGEAIIMPANIPHAVNAKEPFKMMLTMIKEN